MGFDLLVLVAVAAVADVNFPNSPGGVCGRKGLEDSATLFDAGGGVHDPKAALGEAGFGLALCCTLDIGVPTG
jgi:hypothetical protein